MCSTRDVNFGAVGADQSRGFGREFEQRANGGGRSAARAQFENLAEQDKGGDRRGGFEIDRDFAVHLAEGRRENAGEEDGDDAVNVMLCRCRAR